MGRSAKKLFSEILGWVRHRWSVVFQTRTENLLREGRVFARLHDAATGEVIEQELGQNTLTRAFRLAVAKILARKAAQVQAQVGTATFPEAEGYDADDPVFPIRLYVGTSGTPATNVDTGLGYYLTASDDEGSPPLYYPLARVVVMDTVAEYDDVLLAPIHVAFEFDIPHGTLRSGGDAETAPYTLRELGLFDGSGGSAHPIVGAPAVIGDPQQVSASPSLLLARKVVDIPKHAELSLTIRWEIRV